MFPENLLPCDGSLTLTPDAVPDSGTMFDLLMSGIEWRSETATLFGKKIPVPRLVAWHGDAEYSYSGIRHQPKPWNSTLLRLKRIAEAQAGSAFNSVLLNLYRDGRDSMGWHADNERELGPNPTIASLSLGAERKFQIRHRTERERRLSLSLVTGSCLVMAGTMQSHWLHQVPKTTRAVGPRINLTFRLVSEK